MSRKTLVHFGAGNIGRALVGSLFAGAGWRVIFVDALPEIVEAINARGRYTVRVKGPLTHGATAETILVEGVSALNALEPAPVIQAVAEADLVGTAVGGGILPRLAATLALGIERRYERRLDQTHGPLSILMCENLHGAAAILGADLAERLPAGFDLAGRVGLVETSIGKMVPIMPAEVRARDPLEVWGEAYNQIIADAEGFAGEPPAVPGLVVKKNFAAFVDRKLYIHNFGHAAAAYHGDRAGKKAIWACVEDGAIRARVAEAMHGSATALARKYPDAYTEAEQAEHVEDLLARFANRELGDTVFRVGRDLARKLSPSDRCVGALRLAAQQGIPTAPACAVIAAALRFSATDEQGEPFAPDVAFGERIATEGARQVLIDHCGLDPTTPADAAHLESILAAYNAMA